MWKTCHEIIIWMCQDFPEAKAIREITAMGTRVISVPRPVMQHVLATLILCNSVQLP